MPIADAEMNKSANAYLCRPATETVFTALRAWRDTPDSFEWWWLIIEHGERQYTAIRLAGLRDLLVQRKRGVHMNTPLADLPYQRPNPDDPDHPLPGVVSAAVVDSEAVNTTRALEMVQASPGQVLVVLQNGKFRGILSATSRTFAFSDKPLLDLLNDFEMGGESETIIVPRSPSGEDAVVDDPSGGPHP
jgi:hypothetical protein